LFVVWWVGMVTMMGDLCLSIDDDSESYHLSSRQ
jgi:hypothetical protein